MTGRQPLEGVEEGQGTAVVTTDCCRWRHSLARERLGEVTRVCCWGCGRVRVMRLVQTSAGLGVVWSDPPQTRRRRRRRARRVWWKAVTVRVFRASCEWMLPRSVNCRERGQQNP